MTTARPPDETTKIPSATFESIAVDRGLLTPAQVAECRALLQMLLDMGLRSTVAEVYVKKGYLTASQAAAIEQALGRSSAITIPGYEIVEKIAEGGMGAVYKARQISMDRLVAIKVLLPKFSEDKDGRERFVREARAVARLSHPNVVSGIDAGEAHGVCYFVMEYLPGLPVDQAVRERGALPWREATTIIRQVALALEHAHRHGIVHRDVKPGNIMVLADGTAKLADLGLARVVATEDAALTQTGMIVGSPAYLSPEQATGDRAVDIRSDIFSLGLSFFEIIAGERAYSGSNPMTVITALLTRDMPMAKLVAVGVPPDVVAIIARMTQREPDHRYATPSALIEDLDAVLAGHAPSHASVAAPAGGGRGGGRLRTGLLVAALLLLVGLWLPIKNWRPFEPAAAPTEVTTPAKQSPAMTRPVGADAAPAAQVDAIDLVAITEAALRIEPEGTAYQAEYEAGEYSIDLAVGNHTLNLAFAASDRHFLRRIDDDEDHSDAVTVCRLPLTEAIRTAQKAGNGRAVNAEIQLLPGVAVIEIRLERDGKRVWMDIDCATGRASAERNQSRSK